MSRYYDGDWDGEDFPGQWALAEANAERAMKGKRGRKVLSDLREALRALPEKRLIARAMCTVDPEQRAPKPYTSPLGYTNDYERREFASLVEEQGQGVCAVGAYLWWQKVKAGADPVAAFADLPTLPDTEEDLTETALLAKQNGVVFSVAWSLAYRNDETYEELTPEQRYEKFLAWLDEQLSDGAS